MYYEKWGKMKKKLILQTGERELAKGDIYLHFTLLFTYRSFYEAHKIVTQLMNNELERTAGKW
jgi:hypothetical protein